MSIAANLASVRARIEAACREARRNPAEVTLVAVSKTHPPEAIREAYAAGQRDFGENYAQELASKREALSDLTGLRWHFIGAMQSNKAKLVVPGTALVHAVDRPSVAEALSRRTGTAGPTVDLLVEVNVGDESTKAGVAPQDVEPLIEAIDGLPSVRVRGLMCIPPPTNDEATARAAFRRLRVLSDGLRTRHPPMDVLSMGMSDDFAFAVAEGATHVRVGTAIFGARPTRGD
jgi:pyridoxal phosphate enzyme (YggS family)